MSGTLASLVERDLVAPDWAEALAPVEGTIEAMGRFLREEVAAAQRAFSHRAMMNSLAARGEWKADLEKKAA